MPGIRHDRSSLVDIAPTVLRHLGLAADGLDGRPLSAAFPPPKDLPAIPDQGGMGRSGFMEEAAWRARRWRAAASPRLI